MQTPSRERNLNDLNFPIFTVEHVEFFTRMIEIIEQQRLSLITRLEGNELFDIQYACFQTAELEYKWLVNSINAIEEAGRAERVEGRDYNPQNELDMAESADAEVLSDEQITNLL